MKKYVQITIFLGLFFLLVIWRNLRGGNNTAPIHSAPILSSKPTSQVTSAQKYKDGTYTGSVEDAYYGNYQVQLVIHNGEISDINFLEFPNDNSTSQVINQQANPILKSEAIQAQSSQVDIVSGASNSSQAFIQSAQTALNQAKI